MNRDLRRTLEYHQASKHSLGRFAAGPGYLDWATQPDPFRRYQGAPVISLERAAPTLDPPYEASFWAGNLEPAALDLSAVSRLFFDSLAISAWKRAGAVSWALRVNPSSGNLHPSEGYLVCGPVPGLTKMPMVAHYAPREHALEVRAHFAPATWQDLVTALPENTLLLGLSSIHWREAWKYGERAFRYCQHDVGHALAALILAAAGLGWRATLLDGLGTEPLAHLLGLGDPQAAEPEVAECLLAVYPQAESDRCPALAASLLAQFRELSWQGRPNRLSPDHIDWPAIGTVEEATRQPPLEGAHDEEAQQTAGAPRVLGTVAPTGLSLRKIIHQRRSAVAMDPRGRISRDTFYKILTKTLAGPGQYPFTALPWSPHAHLVLFVHRVGDLAPGLYLLVRNPQHRAALQAALRQEFTWEDPSACPEGLPLYRLAAGDVQALARRLSCQQEIASDGCFSLGMLVQFEPPLQRFGPWFYRRLFWECGMIGQVLYLEAEAAGVRGTGIGCFFDDAVHTLLGLQDTQFQSLYHFTVGLPLEDSRLTTLPAYPPAG
jgi:SagB-type dehydrogenase family enzyme